ncbi:MAG: Rrf2 family transcriptional regulator [Akkermansiaceae bacterium]|nr:Rrf2 family transcriptional regulator [Akkermansiaceae bacterium]
MRVSQKLEYACRAAVCLAKHYDGSTVVKLEDIAQQEDISSSFLVQILNELKRSNIVASKRGKAGGYVLARPPATVSLREVVQAVESSLLASPAISSGASGPAVTSVWQELSQTITNHLDSVSLETMASEAGAPMYFI